MPRANSSAKPVMLTASTAQRVARVVAAYESGRRVSRPQRLRTGGGDDGPPMRLCKTVALWTKNTTQTVQVWEDGDFPNHSATAGETIEARNKFATIQSGKFCTVALHQNGGWYLIAAECD